MSSRLLFLSQFRLLYRHPWTTLSLVFGLILGVASVVAVHVVSARIEASLERFTSVAVAGVTHIITRPDLTDADYFDLRDRWRRGELPGLAAMTPVVESSVATSWGRATLVGSDWLTALSPAPDVVKGDVVGKDVVKGDVVEGDAVDGDADAEPTRSRAARDLRGMSAALVGSELVGSELDGENSFEIAGHPLELVGRVPGRRVLVDIATYQRVTNSRTHLSYVAVRFEDPWRWPRNVLNRLMPGLKSVWPEPDGSDLPLDATWRIAPIAADQATIQFGRSVLFNLGALGLLALVVAWLLLYQVAIIWHRQRQRLLARLVQMGANRGDLVRHFVVVFVIIGLLSSGIALVIGVEFAKALLQLMASSAPDAPDGPSPVSPVSPYDAWVTVKALVSGVVVATAAAVMAATRQAVVRPVWLTVVGPACVILLIATLGSGLVAGFLLIVALCWMAGGLVGRLLVQVKRIDRLLESRLLLALGARDVHHHRGDLVVALLALAMAVATTIAMGLMVGSFRSEFEVTLQARLSDDLFVRDIGANQDLAGRLASFAEVERVRAYGRLDARVAGQRVELGFSDIDAEEARRYGVDPALARQPNAALVNDQFAARFRSSVGEAVEIDVEGQVMRVTLAAIFKGFGDTGPRVLVDVTLVPGALRQFDRLSVRTADPSRTISTIQRLAPGANVQDRGGLKATSLDIFDRTFAITRALTLVALVVGTLGIYNSLVMLRLNQSMVTRLFDHLGLSRWEVARIQVTRSLLVAGLAMIVAVPLGVSMAWVLCAWINPAAFGWRIEMTVGAGGELLGPVAFGVLAALAAALAPIPKVADDLG